MTAIICPCLHDPTFSRFGTVLACDRQTDAEMDGRTHDDRIYGTSIALCSKQQKQVRHCGLTHIHTCRSYVHAPRDIPRTARL